jgi:hypothetical protein
MKVTVKIWEIWNYTEEDADEVEVELGSSDFDEYALRAVAETYAEKNFAKLEYPESIDLNIRFEEKIWEFTVTVVPEPTFHAAPRKPKP